MQRTRLKHDYSVDELQRLLRPTARVNIAINIRAGERDDDWRITLLATKAIDGWITAPGVQRNQEIELFIVVLL